MDYIRRRRNHNMSTTLSLQNVKIKTFNAQARNEE